MQVFSMNIEELSNAHPDLFLDHHMAMAAALMHQVSEPPCDFRVECHGFHLPELKDRDGFILRVNWNSATESNGSRILRTEQIRPCVEHAAIGLACLLFARFFPDSRLEATKYGDRADYWLLNQASALEVSGTMSVAAVAKRVRAKSRQLLANPEVRNGYVIVVSFDRVNPMVHWSFHHQEES